MIIALFSIFVAFVIGIIIKKKYYTVECDDFAIWGFTIFIGIILALILHAVTYPVKLERPIITTTEKIVAIKPDSKFESEMRGGLFFYRCRIDEVDYYVYLIEDDGVYRQEKIPVERTSIKETSGHPKVVKSSKYVQNTLPNWIRFNMNSLEKISEPDTLYVPVGTISECSKFVAF